LSVFLIAIMRELGGPLRQIPPITGNHLKLRMRKRERFKKAISQPGAQGGKAHRSRGSDLERMVSACLLQEAAQPSVQLRRRLARAAVRSRQQEDVEQRQGRKTTRQSM